MWSMFVKSHDRVFFLYFFQSDFELFFDSIQSPNVHLQFSFDLDDNVPLLEYAVDRSKRRRKHACEKYFVTTPVITINLNKIHSLIQCCLFRFLLLFHIQTHFKTKIQFFIHCQCLNCCKVLFSLEKKLFFAFQPRTLHQLKQKFVNENFITQKQTSQKTHLATKFTRFSWFTPDDSKSRPITFDAEFLKHCWLIT